MITRPYKQGGAIDPYVKAEESGSVEDIENHSKHLKDIAESPEIAKIWAAYAKGYPYAKGIVLPDILSLIAWVFEKEQRLRSNAPSGRLD